MTAVTVSAPALPNRARRSDMRVNPEMSTKTTEPSNSRWSAPGLSSSHSLTTRGTYASRETEFSVGAVARRA